MVATFRHGETAIHNGGRWRTSRVFRRSWRASPTNVSYSARKTRDCANSPRTEGSIPDSKPASATSDQNAAADCGAAKAAVAVPAQAAPELSTIEKISLFRALFRGREDVFAVRWESGEKAGYSPASIRDWTALRGVSKSEWKKRDKATRQLLPLTDQAIHDHLSGKTTIGVYPLLPNETCWFLAVDFDQKTWKDDASSFVDSCRE